MMNLLHGLILLMFALLPVTACATGQPVQLTKANLGILEGTWKGNLEARGMDNVVYFESPLVMELTDGKGTLTLQKTGAKAAVVARDGKVFARLSGSDRELALTRTHDGKLRLSTSYQAKFQQWDQNYTVVLEK
jgi:hypothetical protein